MMPEDEKSGFSMPDFGGIAQAGQFLSGLVSNTGTRMSDEHFREGINRSNIFLEGTTPTNANAYNTYQDMTYGQDTARMSQRAKDLGMSNWELLGKGATSPVQSFGDQKAGDTQFLSQQMPLKIAEMQARTQLANTFLQTQTAKDINNQQTQSGALPAKQVEEAAARIRNIDMSNITQANQQAISYAKALYDILPTETVKTPFYDRTAKANWPALAKFLGTTQSVQQYAENDNDNPPSTRETADKVTRDTAERLMNEAKAFANWAVDQAKNAGKGMDNAGRAISGAIENAGNFLKNLK